MVKMNDAKVTKVHTDNNIVDPLTKILQCDKHDLHANGHSLFGYWNCCNFI